MQIEIVAIILIGFVALLSYRLGKNKQKREELQDEVEANENREAISRLSDSELDDELRDYWK